MALRISRPAFMEGVRAYKASQGVMNVNRDATPNEMRAYVCGQCHVEYYFKGDEKRLVFPWSKGIHARAGVTCSDCHMPKTEFKGASLSDHWVRSPLLNIKNACLDCHRKRDPNLTEIEMKSRVEQIQDRHWSLREHAMTSLLGLIGDLTKTRRRRPRGSSPSPSTIRARAQIALRDPQFQPTVKVVDLPPPAPAPKR